MLYNAPCIVEGQWPRKVRDGLGHVRTVRSMSWRQGPCLIEWEALERYLRERGQMRDGKIGEADNHLMLGAHVLGATVNLALKLCPQCPTRPTPLPA
jgi:hypothetical protein